MELSKRLQAVANLITGGYAVADVGTDHGYIPIYLVNTGKNTNVIAMDVNEGPLERAREHIREQAGEGVIETRLSDGLEKLEPGEVQSIVIAGMGGGLTVKILSQSRDVTESLQECILQPQSEIAKVRAFLLEEGFSIIQEDMVCEEGKFYPMMRAVHGTEKEQWQSYELLYGKRLLEERHPVLKLYLEKERKIKTEILKQLAMQNGPNIEKRRDGLHGEIACIEDGLRRM